MSKLVYEEVEGFESGIVSKAGPDGFTGKGMYDWWGFCEGVTCSCAEVLSDSSDKPLHVSLSHEPPKSVRHQPQSHIKVGTHHD